MEDSVVIDPRFGGPPGSGNGGYSCGLLGTRLTGPAEVTLRKPPPLGRPLRLSGEAPLLLLDGDVVVAEARRATIDLEIPAPPSFEQAQALSAWFVGHRDHNFPGCFTCGPDRAPGDGLRIFAGRQNVADPVAAPWIPDPSVGDPAGLVDPAVHWAALDCPGFYGAAPPDYPPALLGRMTAEVTDRVRVGERCVVLGWGLGLEGRKIFAATALFGEGGRLVGRARQTWIRI